MLLCNLKHLVTVSYSVIKLSYGYFLSSQNYRPSPHLSQTPLQHPHITTSNPHEPAHNSPSSFTQNGRATPHLISADFPPGNSSQNERFTHHNLAIPDLQNGISSQNGRFTPQLTTPDLQHSSSSQNERFTPHLTTPDLQPSSSSQNVRFTPHLNSLDFQAGSTTPDHRRTTFRESPTGQSSSNPDPTSGSNNSSQLSADSASTKTFSTFKPQKSNASSDPTIGPSSKYPDAQIGMRVTLSDDKRADARQVSSPHFASKTTSPRRQNISTSEPVVSGVKESLARPLSRFSSAFLDSDGSFEDEYSLQPHDSIFNYHDGGSEDGTVTPQASSQATLSSHAPRRRSVNSTPVAANPGFPDSASPDFVPKTPDLLRKSPEDRTRLETSGGTSRTQQAETKSKSQLGTPLNKDYRSTYGQHIRSKSLDDVRESENDSLLSFDVENTILTVEPSDQSDRGTVRSHKGSNSVRAQLQRLEGMYSHVMKTLGEASHGTRTRRRWSIGSSDTSSMRHHSHHSLHSRTSGHKLGGRDVKAIGKRFQRLESHVITLARSVAHLSSEMRVQNSLSREMENVKREIQELKSQRSASPALPGNLVRPNRLLSDFERYQGWVPSLTNPRRVNKLTKFFGQEPPLLEIFLKQLGYEKYLQNFEKEHIGMIELPYMTEVKLQTLGIPMGPRLRILQEAQVYLKQANLDLYFV
ncbi:unnamed protein product [Candidula unifasciata]|uniref:SAM domain-containing protein n=1 Tax=Candidula unifasciata TaxID=100452 RepID=A0A8S3ZM00_9EUPU|nr:unnamed protein product [Candidula unifasciata]